jgi:uncharacterized repeat protein (TIGR03803 family)
MTENASPESFITLLKGHGQPGRPSTWGALKTGAAVLLLCAATAIASSAQTFTDLLSFDGTDGSFPYAGLVQGADGNLYGTTYNGGTYGYGTVFEISAAGKLTTLYNFCPGEICTDGMNPNAGLVQATNGNFYGTTLYGGPNGDGNIFEITPAGKLTSIYLFCPQVSTCPDGSSPYAGLVQASNGRLYGATTTGGNNNLENCSGGCGTIFDVSLTGTLTTLYSFCSVINSQGYCADGMYTFSAAVQAADGNFYGTTQLGGAYNQGTFFEMTTAGKLTTLYSFCAQVNGHGYCANGSHPSPAPVQAANGNFYGTTYYGGVGNAGTVFEMTPAGELTRLYSFCYQPDCTGGSTASLIQASDGNLYGTAAGQIFKITLGGKLTTLYSPDDAQGEILNGLVQGTDGMLYGTSAYGGSSYDGTIFSFAVGLRPFVETRPASGKVGSGIVILGNSLKSTTGVSFNGTAATFTVVSATEIKTNVPVGATSGTVQVTTATGQLSSNVPFRVEP